MTDPIDCSLARLLATPEREPDDAFVARVDALVHYEAYRARRRRAVYQRVAIGAAAGAAVLAAFVGAARIGEPSDIVTLFSPAMAGLLALALWGAVTLRAPRQTQRG